MIPVGVRGPGACRFGVEREGATAPPTVPPPEPEPAPRVPKPEWEITRVVARVVSFLGWLTVVFGAVGLPIVYTMTEAGQQLAGHLLWALVLQVFSVCTIGLIVVLIGHVSRAIVDIREGKHA